jgi:hypothetical protein
VNLYPNPAAPLIPLGSGKISPAPLHVVRRVLGGARGLHAYKGLLKLKAKLQTGFIKSQAKLALELTGSGKI